MFRALRNLIVLCLCWAPLPPVQAAENASLRVADGTDIPYTVFAGRSDKLLVWLPSEAGLQNGETRSAEALAKDGISVWLVDPFTARFLPIAQSSMDQIPGSDVAALIDAGRSRGKTVYLVGTGRAAIPLLRGARTWQQRHPQEAGLGGVILLSPKFFVETPDPGQAAELMPVVRATDLPIFILQPAQSPWRWKLDQTVPALESQGSDVYVRILPGVRDRFYFRPDSTPAEDALAQQLPALLRSAVRMLDWLPAKARQAAPLPERAPPVLVGKKDRELKPYAGNPTPPALVLEDLAGHRHDLRDYRGQVVLVNFWASWCPPCVHEMPSMERLRRHMAGRPFAILAVNMAEERGAIETFLHSKIKVTFPILLDRDGGALKRWGVFAFPTSYVIDAQGRIHYALFGSFDWDAPDVIAKLEALLPVQH